MNKRLSSSSLKTALLSLPFLGSISFIQSSYAQVSDVSVIVAPTASYNWFDSKSTIDNGFMYGVQAGFSFGTVVELKAIYERSADLKQNFGRYEGDINNVIPGFTGFKNRNIKVTRFGGEFKTNIPLGNLSPYILLGTGVQKFEREMADDTTYTNENLYGSAGLGFKINMGRRVTLNLEGRGLFYNMNPTSLLYNPGGPNDFDQWINSKNKTQMYNWSVSAGLQFYLGGTDISNFSAMEKAYFRRFSSGMQGLKVTLAPEGAYVNFNSNSPFRSTYLLGGQIGIDFTDFVGLRGYYYQATADKNPSFNFDKLAMYGVDFVGRLNVARGIVPYITIGGGMIDVQDDYKGKVIDGFLIPVYQTVQNTYFAKGGLGLDVPLGRYVDAYGAANLIFTTDNNRVKVTELNSAKQLQQSTMFNVGLKLKLGKKARAQYNIGRYYSPYTDNSNVTNNYNSTDNSYYNKQKDSLQNELYKAYQNNDTQKMSKIVEEKKVIESHQQIINTIDSTGLPTEDQLIRLTPAELNEMIDKVIKGVESSDSQSVERRLERLEQMLKNPNFSTRYYNYQNSTMPNQAAQTTSAVQTTNTNVPSNTTIDSLNLAIAKLNTQLAESNAKMNNLLAKPHYRNDSLVIVNKTEVNKEPVVVNQSTTTTTTATPQATTTETTQGSKGTFLNSVPEGMGVFIGPSFGSYSSFNVGVRSYTGFANNDLIFMPEAYLAFGKSFGFGVSANAIIPVFKKYTGNFTPYVGAGLGLNFANKKMSFNPNFIGGVDYQLGKGKVFADYTVRGAFKFNQLAIGYRFMI